MGRTATFGAGEAMRAMVDEVVERGRDSVVVEYTRVFSRDTRVCAAMLGIDRFMSYGPRERRRRRPSCQEF